MHLSDIIVQVSRAAILGQQNDGSFAPGCNGPYKDAETPVRNTAHYVITLLKAYEISADKTFYAAAQRAAEYLCSLAARPMNGSFYCRTNPEKDLCNGLIGQAWVIEALAYATQWFLDNKYQALAREVFLLHPFDPRKGLWRRLAVDGSYLSYDLTFNHQLWFAASGALVASDTNDDIRKRVSCFLDNAAKSNLSVSRTGRITHLIRPKTSASFLSRLIKDSVYGAKTLMKQTQVKAKEIGYHPFNLYAMAMLQDHFPENALWENSKLVSAIKYIQHHELKAGLEGNQFAYPYNPSGFEVAYALQAFPALAGNSEDSKHWWVNQQIKRTFDFRETAFSINTDDKATLTARLYEATRLDDVEIDDSKGCL
jgi:hypothetical protein